MKHDLDSRNKSRLFFSIFFLPNILELLLIPVAPVLRRQDVLIAAAAAFAGAAGARRAGPGPGGRPGPQHPALPPSVPAARRAALEEALPLLKLLLQAPGRNKGEGARA